jgi:hypothetical protein
MVDEIKALRVQMEKLDSNSSTCLSARKGKIFTHLVSGITLPVTFFFQSREEYSLLEKKYTFRGESGSSQQ